MDYAQHSSLTQTLRASLRACVKLPAAALFGAALVAALSLAIIFAPLLTSYDATSLGAVALRPPSLEHLMGTDDLGRDVFARVLYGGRISLLVGTVAAIISVTLGLLIGVVAGFSGGAVDEALMRATEVFQIVPRLLVAIVVVAMIGGSITSVIFVIGILSWPLTARLIRAQTLVLRREEFISAATMSGASYSRLIVKQILPNILPLLLVTASMQVAVAIMAEAALSFLGLGDPSFPSWGQMLQQSQGFLRQAWWMSFFPGCALALIIFGLNLLSDGFSDRLPGGAS